MCVFSRRPTVYFCQAVGCCDCFLNDLKVSDKKRTDKVPDNEASRFGGNQRKSEGRNG